MKTTADAERILYEHINGSDLDLACDGVLRKWNRPDQSDKEDIIINSPVISLTQIQRTIANVNIYVKDIIAPGDSHNKLQNSGRVAVLSKMAVDLLKEVSGVDTDGEEYDFWATNQTIFSEPEKGQHFINIRVEFQFFPK